MKLQTEVQHAAADGCDAAQTKPELASTFSVLQCQGEVSTNHMYFLFCCCGAVLFSLVS